MLVCTYAGPLPPVAGVGMVVLELFNNRLTGSIPSGLIPSAALAQLNLANNSLTGTLPTTLTKAVNLMILALNDNALSGSLGSVFNGNASQQFPGLQMVSLSSNKLT